MRENLVSLAAGLMDWGDVMSNLATPGLRKPLVALAVLTVVWANIGPAIFKSAHIVESTTTTMRASLLAVAHMLMSRLYCGSPMRRRISLKRGSERRGAKPGSTFTNCKTGSETAR